jgi:translocation protein SEC63
MISASLMKVSCKQHSFLYFTNNHSTDSLAGQMHALKTGAPPPPKKKKIKQEESSDEESNTEEEVDDTSETDTDTDEE